MMITLIKRLFLSTLVLLLASPSLHAAEKFTLDDQHSYVVWRIKHLGFSTQTGKWYVKGFVILDKEHPQNSKVEAHIDIANIVTGLPELDKHLKSKAFFDTEKYPTATFVSNKVDVTGKDSAKVTGTLNLHGVSKHVTLMVTLNKIGKSPINDKNTVGFSATTEIKRSDFGMNTLLPALGDDVSIDIGAEANQSS
jgi:polyisoprenoid-binding protein YceI